MLGVNEECRGQKMDEQVSLSSLSQLTGFSEEMIRTELSFPDDTEGLSLDQLRDLMAAYLNATMLD